MAHRVTAPYVTVKVRDVTGARTLRGFYAGAVLGAEADQDDLDRLTRKGMIEKLEDAPPAEEPKADEPKAEEPAPKAKPAARG